MPQSGALFAPVSFKTRFPALDGIRAIAVTMVFFHHFGGGSHGSRTLQVINQMRLRSWVGVDLFFVLSGFLVTGILFDTRHDSHFFKRFFARRSVRIFPVYYLMAAILLLATPFLHLEWKTLHLWFLAYMGNIVGLRSPSLDVVLSSAGPVFQVSLGHLWSLCVEEQFYLLWPIAVWLVRDRVKLIWTASILSVVAMSLRFAAWYFASAHHPATWLDRTLPLRMDTLLVGAVLALMLRSDSADRWQRACRPLFVVGSLVTLVLLFIVPETSVWFLVFGRILPAMASAGLIGMTLRTDSIMFRFFHVKAMRTLGKYSYGFYVFHFLFAGFWIYFLSVSSRFFHSMALGGIVTLGLNFVLVYIAAMLSFNLFEVKFLHLKKNFAYDSELRDRKPVLEAEPEMVSLEQVA